MESRRAFDDYLSGIGVRALAPATCPFDPGVAPVVLESHLQQSAHLMLSLKISMACWMVAAESATRSKVSAARAAGVPTSTGGGPYEIAVAQGRLSEYLDLCADVGFDGVECGAGFTDPRISAQEVVRMAARRGLQVEYEVGKKHCGEFDLEGLRDLLEEGRRWLGAGARTLVIEARESAAGIGIFGTGGRLNSELAERIVTELGLSSVVFEAPSKASQFALLDHFGPHVQLANVPLDEVLRVEIYRRGLHSDAFLRPNLRPPVQAASLPAAART